MPFSINFYYFYFLFSLKIIEEKDASDSEKDIDEINTGVYLFDIKLLRSVITNLKSNNSQKELYLTDVIGLINESGKSAYARQFLGQMDKPDVDVIEGLSPAISIDQKTASKNPRSTVGTITEIYDYLRLLWARIGVQHCPKDGIALQRQTPQQIVDRILELPAGTRFQVLAPVVRGRKGEYENLLGELLAQGYSRARIDDQVVDISEFLKKGDKLARYENHSIDIIVDRLVQKAGINRRLTDSLETALKLADGVAGIEIMSGKGDEQGEVITFSQHMACPKCSASFDELAPRNFSFNSPFGACETCLGLGTVLGLGLREL